MLGLRKIAAAFDLPQQIAQLQTIELDFVINTRAQRLMGKLGRGPHQSHVQLSALRCHQFGITVDFIDEVERSARGGACA